MMREEKRREEEPRGASGVAEDRGATEGKSEKIEADMWTDVGTEDPAFYLKFSGG